MGANLLHECVGVLHMQLAPQNSWVWATNPKWKKELSISLMFLYHLRVTPLTLDVTCTMEPKKFYMLETKGVTKQKEL